MNISGRIFARTVRASAIAVTAALVLSLTASGQAPAGSKVELPDTAIGKLAASLLGAINTGDKQKMREFIVANLSENTLRDDSPDGLAADLKRLYEQTGGLEVMQVLPERGPGEIWMKLRSKRGNHWVRFGTRFEKGQPGKLDGWGLRAALDPETEKAEAWPEARLGDVDVVKEIERHAASAAARDAFSGAVLVAKGDRVIFNQAYGNAEKNFCSANKVDTKFNLGSMNKMFTSVAIAQLVQAGKLSYDETLAKALPEYPNKEVAAKITIHQLLTHTSGLGDFFKPEFFKEREKYINPRDYFPIFANDSLRFEPGKGWSYSNAGFIVLGAVVEKISGENYFDYIREHIYKAAGMKDSDSFRRDEVVGNLAYGYTRFEGNDPLGLEPRRINWMTLPIKGSSAGGGYSSTLDLLKFAQALRGHKLLNAELTEKITSAKVDTPWGSKYCYGFDDATTNGKSIRGHGGGAPGINSDLKMFWDGSYTVIVMGNYDPPAAQDLSQKIAEFLSRQ